MRLESQKLFLQVPRSLKYAVAKANAIGSYYWLILDTLSKTQKYHVMIEFVWLAHPVDIYVESIGVIILQPNIKL